MLDDILMEILDFEPMCWYKELSLQKLKNTTNTSCVLSEKKLYIPQSHYGSLIYVYSDKYV